MDDYKIARELSVSPEDAIRCAKTMLAANGFRVESESPGSLVCVGPGLRSTRQNAILGASRIVISVSQPYLTLIATLDAVRSMQRFVRWFPIGLGLGLGIVLGIVQGFVFGAQTGVGFGVPWASGWKWMALMCAGSLLPVSPWFIISPMIAKSLNLRCQAALETLLINSAG